MRNISYMLIAALIATAPAIADDGSASLAAGGIVFTKNIAVRMAAEDLYISPKQVRVRFEFVNDTAKDIETIVAFPMPDIDLRALSDVYSVGATTDDPRNFVGFKAAVDGKPIVFKAEQRAFVGGKDVTQTITATGLPINVVKGGYKIFKTISPVNRKGLTDAGILYHDPVADEYIAQWLVRTRFYWTQRFQTHETVVIEHSYQPVSGVGLFPEDWAWGGFNNKFVRSQCINPHIADDVAALAEPRRKAIKGPQPASVLSAWWTNYILTTANTWSGPIGRFHLTLDKLKPDNVLSLCWDGELKKTGPTTFESVRTNFSPKQDIHMLVLE